MYFDSGSTEISRLYQANERQEMEEPSICILWANIFLSLLIHNVMKHVKFQEQIQDWKVINKSSHF